ncbi:MAG: HEAT repeat domain-containing protein [Candidatus Heimdallarchaeota archaeon]|nr:MAG: HEAT repeat domain-containing protein [Candidatus Heimdallarchaeota archaeon]
MTKQNRKNVEILIKKLHEDPDKFERMFAAQYLAKYNLSRCEVNLKKAVLEDPDPDVVQSIRKLLKDDKSKK